MAENTIYLGPTLSEVVKHDLFISLRWKGGFYLMMVEWIINHLILCTVVRKCLHGGEPALLVGLALVRWPNFTSPLHESFLALLAGMNLAPMRSLIFPSPSDCVYVENTSPPWQYFRYSMVRSRFGGLALSCKRKQILQRISQGGGISAKKTM